MSKLMDVCRIYILVLGALFVLGGTALGYAHVIGEIDLPAPIILIAIALLYFMGSALIYAMVMPGGYYVWRAYPNPYLRWGAASWPSGPSGRSAYRSGPRREDRWTEPQGRTPVRRNGGDRWPGHASGAGGYEAWLRAPYHYAWEWHSRDEKVPANRLDLPDQWTLLAVFVFSIVAGSTILVFARSDPLLYLGFPLAFIIAFSFPPLIWISYVYKKEYTPEPRRGMLIALTWGMLSTNLAIVIEGAFTSGLFVLAVIMAPVVEELVKPLGLPALRRWISNPTEGLVFGVACGMGFAMVENLLYEAIFLYEDLQTAVTPVLWGSGSLMRGLLSTMGHAVGTGLIGYAYGLHRHRQLTGRELEWYRVPTFTALAVAIAIGLHASWNGSAYLAEVVHPGFIGVALVVAFAEIYFLLLLTRRAVRISWRAGRDRGCQFRHRR